MAFGQISIHPKKKINKQGEGLKSDAVGLVHAGQLLMEMPPK